MSELSLQFHNQQGGVLGQATASREMEEVKGAIFLAKQFPRNVFQAEQRILDSCKRSSLAEVAMYQYPRGGTKVSGPSIRLAEVLAQNWGNLSFGVKELEQLDGESVAMAYAWDLETNVRQEKVFTVKHNRQARGSVQKITDPRDIYELVASSGARRVRACVLGIIPGDIVDKAVAECEKTLQGNNKGPLKDRVANALKGFKENHRVTQETIEAKFGYNAESFTEYDYVELIKIFTSLKDGMSKVEDWFEKEVAKKSTSDLTEAFEKGSNKEASVDGKTKTTAETPTKQSELPQ